MAGDGEEKKGWKIPWKNIGQGFLDYGLPLAGELGGGILEWFGNAERRKMARDDRTRLIDSIGKPVFNPYGVAAAGRRAIAGQRDSLGKHIDATLGLDTGAGAGALAENLVAPQQDLLMQAIIKEASARSARDAQTRRSLYAGSIGGL